MRLVAASVFVAQVALWGQGPRVTVSGDGNIVHLRTRARPAGAAHEPWDKVYRLEANGVQLIHTATDAQDLSGISASADGRSIAISASSVCWSSGSCARRRDAARILTPGDERAISEWSAELNSTGTHAALFLRTRSPIEFPLSLERLTLATGRVEPLNAVAVAPSGVWISSNGTILAHPRFESRQWMLYEPNGTSRPLSTTMPDDVRSAVLADDASFVIYETAEGLWRLTLDGTRSLLIPGGSAPSLARNGRRLLYMTTAGLRRLFLFENGQSRQVGDEHEDILEGRISGDGATAIALTASHRLLSHRLDTGETKEWIGQFPFAEYGRVYGGYFTAPTLVQYPMVPGSTYRLRGRNLAGARVSVDGRPALPITYTETFLYFQLPEDLPLASDRPIRVAVQSPGAAWETVYDIAGLRPAAPYFFELADNAYAIHGDWRGLVTRADPAKPEEVLHFYVSGLADCRWTSGALQNLPVDVLYAGPAPALIGISQLSLRVPRDLSGDLFFPGCPLLTFDTNQRSMPTPAVPFSR